MFCSSDSALIAHRSSLGTSQKWSDPLTVSDRLGEDLAVLIHLDIALAAKEHQTAVIAEIPVPLDDLLVGPVGRILQHLFIRHAIEVGAQIDARFIPGFFPRFLFEVPDRLFHSLIGWVLVKNCKNG